MVDLEMNQEMRKSTLLSVFMRAWGAPIDRRHIRKGSDCIEVHLFGNPIDGVVNRFVSIGLSACISQRTQSSFGKELLLVLPLDNGGATRERTFSFLLDVCTYCLKNTVSCLVGETIPHSQNVPEPWLARSFLFDEPRGEPEFVSNIRFQEEDIEVVWLVPIYENERLLIISNGIDAFDQLEAASEWSLADPNRPSLIGES